MKKILMIGLLIISMSSFAWANSSNYDHATGQFDHVTLPQGLVGDAMIFPVYLADGSGWETKIQVINTSNSLSTVAKVIFCGGKNSQEILDFMIYLSPDDMWTATIYNDNGVVRVFSDDDSVRSSSTTWGDEVPLNQALINDPCDEEVYGYVTLFDDWAMDRVTIDRLYAPAGDTYLTGPIPKPVILQAYSESSVYNSANVLTGSFEVKLPTLGLSAAENAVVFQDYDVDVELTVGTLTFFGQQCRNSIAEVEAELSKDSVFMPYYDDGQNVTAHIFTFPTKESLLDSDCDVAGTNSRFFQQNTIDYCVEYGIKPFDLEENTPASTDPIFSPVPEEERRVFCEEVNISVVGLDSAISFYDEGWALFTFQLNSGMESSGLTDSLAETIYFTGAPVIPLSANLGADGLSLKYGAYDPASIRYEYATQQ